MNGWIKLHRQLRNHPIMRDPTAFQIFIWILISVDYKTGKMISGRFWASDELKIKPRTFHKALTERLRDRYDLVTLSSDNKNTVISVKNWDKYQHSGDTSGDTSVTTKGQQSDTKQEYKEEKNIKNKHSSIKSLTDEVVNNVAQYYSVNPKSVFLVRENLVGWCQAKGKVYKNYRAALQNWVR